MSYQPKRLLLDTGATLLSDRDARLDTAAFAVCLRGGLRAEAPELNGISHLLEHLLMKRTKNRTPREIAQKIDSLGASFNALTDAESVCLYCVVPKRHAEESLAFLLEMLAEVSLLERDFDIEKKIVRQEILDAEDDPHEAVYRRFSRAAWPGNPLGLPVEGTIASFEAITMAQLRAHLDETRVGSNLLVVASGAVEEKKVVQMVSEALKPFTPGCPAQWIRPERGLGLQFEPLPFSQLHFLLGCAFPAQNEPLASAAEVLAVILGGGMSSRLFQTLREEHGMVYDVSAAPEVYADVGMLIISGSVEPHRANKALSLLMGELLSLRDAGVGEDELQRAVSLAVAERELARDSVRSRLWAEVEAGLAQRPCGELERQIEQIKAIEMRDIRECIDRYLAQNAWLAVLGGEIEGVEVPDILRAFCGGMQRERDTYWEQMNYDCA